MIEDARRQAGRNGPFEVTCSVATPDARLVARYEEAGVTRLMVGPPPTPAPRPVDDVTAWLRQFADEVIDRG